MALQWAFCGDCLGELLLITHSPAALQIMSCACLQGQSTESVVESPTAAASAAARAVAAAALASMGSLSRRQQQEVVAAAAAGSEGLGDSPLLELLSLRCLLAMLLHALPPVSCREHDSWHSWLQPGVRLPQCCSLCSRAW